MIYFGIDPGVTTGMVMVDDAPSLTVARAGLIALQEVTALDIEEAYPFKVAFQLRQYFRDQAAFQKRCVVICERSIIYGSRTPQEVLLNVRIEGAIEFVAKDCGVPVYFQPPGARSAYQKLASLRLAKLKGRSRHSTDAYAHFLAYQKSAPTKEEAAWLIQVTAKSATSRSRT